ncbi:MAG: hypothetical protein IKV25_02765 [Clostridia bacterium]|nr:hypothetical protein [Clostridia bacterium]
MRKELEDLWESYIIEVPMERTAEEKEIIKSYSEKENLLRSKLTAEQKELLEEYDNAVCETNSISEKYAFIKGVRFTTRLIFEAFCDD